MATKPPDRSQPTRRQTEILAFIQTFTDRRGVPPSFEEIARHFMTTTPSVNGMVKTLEARGFLTRVPGQARTLRVLVPRALLVPSEPHAAKRGESTHAGEIKAVEHLACMVAERLVPVLRGAGEPLLYRALDAVREALDATCRAAGASEDEQRQAHEALRRTALAAQGMNPSSGPVLKPPRRRRAR